MNQWIQILIVTCPCQRSDAFDAKVERVDTLVNELKQKHGDKYNKVNNGLKPVSMTVKKYCLLCLYVTKKSSPSVSEMASAFTTVANTVANPVIAQNHPPLLSLF